MSQLLLDLIHDKSAALDEKYIELVLSPANYSKLRQEANIPFMYTAIGHCAYKFHEDTGNDPEPYKFLSYINKIYCIREDAAAGDEIKISPFKLKKSG